MIATQLAKEIRTEIDNEILGGLVKAYHEVSKK